MTPLVPITLFAWVPFTIFLFFRLPPHRAVLVAVIAGWLFLPMAGYNVPGIPQYDKFAAISLGLILGGRFSGSRSEAGFQWKLYDLPMVLWCLAPIPSSLSNQMGLYDGLSGTYGHLMVWGIPYLAGRVYFRTPEALRDLCLGIVIGGMVYSLLCLWEIRMSPRLSINIYGHFPHEWRQHRRYGGWRPIVFMQHGLMVAVWMAATGTAAFWLWRGRIVDRIKGIPMGLIVAVLGITTVLCKSASGWVALFLGLGSYFVCRRAKGYRPLILLLFIIPIYVGVRISGMLPMAEIEELAAKIFDAERTESLSIRLYQETLFSERAMERLWFGWARASRGWPIDPYTGQPLINMVDALWTIYFNHRGLFGISTWLAGMLIGPWLALRSVKGILPHNEPQATIVVVLSLIVVLFMIDSLFNGMVNPIYILCSGALAAWVIAGNRISPCIPTEDPSRDT